jgi:hypothetical protein
MIASIIGTRIEYYPVTACAIVDALTPRGTRIEWTVTLDRHGKVKDAVRHIPSYAYRAGERVPQEIAQAAMTAWRQVA